MSKTIEFNETGEWTMDDAIEMPMNEASIEAEVEAQERRLNWAWEMIENRGKKQADKQVKKQAGKRAMKRAMKQAMMNWNE